MDEKKNIYTALADFQKEIKPIPLTKEVTVTPKNGGGSYKFKYATLPAIIEAIQPVMEKCGLAFSQTVTGKEIVTNIYHKSGESITSSVPFPMPDGLDAQKVGSWVSYIKRYGLTTALGLTAEEDDDANIADGNRFAAKAVTKQPLRAGAENTSVTQWKTPKCPKCAGMMSVKYSKVNQQEFFGCQSYPRCKGTLPIEAAQTLAPNVDVGVPFPPEEYLL